VIVISISNKKILKIPKG